MSPTTDVAVAKAASEHKSALVFWGQKWVRRNRRVSRHLFPSSFPPLPVLTHVILFLECRTPISPQRIGLVPAARPFTSSSCR